MSDRLKPCPFCGGKAELRTGEIKATIEETLMTEQNVRCSTHGCGARFIYMTVSEWNTRKEQHESLGNEHFGVGA